MEQEQILSTLKEKAGLSGQTAYDRTLNFYIGQNLPSDGAEPDEDYFNKHSEFIKTLSGQFSHDVASEVNNFKKNYKPQTVEPVIEPNGGDEMPQWAKEIKEQLEAQKTKETQMASKAKKEQILKSAYDKAKEGGAVNDAVLEIVKASIDISESDTETSVKDKIVSKYNEMYKKLYGNGAHPSVTQIPSSENRKAEDEKFKELLRRNGKLPKKN